MRFAIRRSFWIVWAEQLQPFWGLWYAQAIHAFISIVFEFSDLTIVVLFLSYARHDKEHKGLIGG